MGEWETHPPVEKSGGRRPPASSPHYTCSLPSRPFSPFRKSSPTYIQLGGLEERCKLPQRGLGRSPSRNRIWRILAGGNNFDDCPENQLTKFRAV